MGFYLLLIIFISYSFIVFQKIVFFLYHLLHVAFLCMLPLIFKIKLRLIFLCGDQPLSLEFIHYHMYHIFQVNLHIQSVKGNSFIIISLGLLITAEIVQICLHLSLQQLLLWRYIIPDILLPVNHKNKMVIQMFTKLMLSIQSNRVTYI